MKAVVIGLGNIGGAIASRLSKSLQVLGVDQDDARRKAWSTRTGQESASSLRDIDWHSVDRALVVVRSSAAALAITEDIGQHAPTTLACHIMTTLEYADALALHDSTKKFPHVRVLEQPVSGGAVGAEAGTLTVLAAGPSLDEDLEFLRTHLAGQIRSFAQYGQPTLVKLLNNGVAAYNLIVHAWALETAACHGIDAGIMQQVLQSSSGGSTIGDLLPSMGPEQGELLHKDVRLLEGALSGELPVIKASETALPSKLAQIRSLTTTQPSGVDASLPE